MKRGGPPKRRSPLGRGSSLKRTALKPIRKAAAQALDKIASEAWAKGARTQECAVCGRRNGPIRGHHAIPQQTLRRVSRELGLNYERLRWDARNRLACCDRCHTDHHAASGRIGREVLVRACPQVFELARELDGRYDDGRSPMTRLLEETYPA